MNAIVTADGTVIEAGGRVISTDVLVDDAVRHEMARQRAHAAACCVTDDPVWVAGYRDGSQLLECNGLEDHAFADVDQDALEWFALVPRRAEANPYAEAQHVVKQTEGTKVIFFRRRQIELSGLSDDDDDAQTWLTVPVIGLKVTSGDRVAKVYQFLLPNGSTLLTDDYQAI